MSDGNYLRVLRLRMMFDAIAFYQHVGFNDQDAYQLFKMDQRWRSTPVALPVRHPACRSTLV